MYVGLYEGVRDLLTTSQSSSLDQARKVSEQKLQYL